MRHRCRLSVATTLAVIIVVAAAAPADAHTIGGATPTNYRSELGPVSPPIDGVTMRLLDLGRRVRLTSAARADVVIMGYGGEPYLRVGPRGVFENTRSPTVSANATTSAAAGSNTTTTLPIIANALGAPSWRKVSSARSVTWRDRRTRWEGPTPQTVKASPGDRHVVRTWTLYLEDGNTASTVVARIEWVPPPSATPWLVVAGLLFAATFAMTFRRWWADGLSAAIAVLIANDVVHSFAAAAASGDSLPLTMAKVLVGGFYGTVAWIVGILAIRGLRSRDDTTVLFAGIVGFFIALLGGATDAAGLGRSQLLFVYPPVVARAEVATSLGIGFGLAAAAAWLLVGPRLRNSRGRSAT